MLTYDNIKGKRGVWRMFDSPGKPCSATDLFVADGKGNEWHGTEGHGYCCENRHNQYLYQRTSYRVEDYAKGGSTPRPRFIMGRRDRRVLL